MIIEQRDLSQMLETAVVAARLAGQHAMEELNYVKSSIKNGNEMVTHADAACQKIIIDRIKENYPDHGFLAEEGDDGDIFKQQPRGKDDIWWVIDPIDGTNNFAHGMLLFGVSIAVMYEGQPIVGVIFEPATDSMYTSFKGGETQLNGRRIQVSEDIINEFASTGLDSHYKDNVPQWICEIMKRTKFRNLGTSALQLVYVAKGSLIGTYISCPKLWDFAAGAIIVENAGGMFTDWQGQKVFPVDVNSYERKPFEILAANKNAYPQLLEIMKS